MKAIQSKKSHRIFSMLMALVMLFSISTVYASAAGSEGLTTPGTYTVPITSLVSSAPLPPVAEAFSKAFGTQLMVEVDENGDQYAVVDTQNMPIDMGNILYANVLKIAGGEVLSTKQAKSTITDGSYVEIEVPSQIRYPLNVNENGVQVLSITVDFMNGMYGSEHFMSVTLTLNLRGAVYDTAELAETIASYASLNQANYTEASWNAYMAALGQANALVNGGAASDVYAAMTGLNTAAQALIYLPADYSLLNAALQKVPTNAAAYTESSWEALQNVVSAVQTNLGVDQQAQVNAWATDIEAKIAELQAIEFDYTKLDEAIAKVPADLSRYTKATAEALQAAVDAAKARPADLNQEMIDNWTKDIEAKITALVFGNGDYSKVDKAIAKVPADLSKYTKATVESLKAAIDAVVRELKADKQDTINAWATDIEAKIANLVYLDADYSKVDEALAKVPADLGKYTLDSAEKVKTATEAVVRNLKVNEQEKVNQMAVKIEEAVAALAENKPGSIDKDNLTDGIYEVPVWLWHATNNQASMAATSLNSTARIVVKNGVKTMYIYTKPMTFGNIVASLQEMKVYDLNGNYKDGVIEATDSEGNPTTFSFTLPHTENYIKLKVNPHVEMMGNQDLDARLRVDYSSIKKISTSSDDSSINVKAPAKGSSAPASVNDIPKTGDDSNMAIYFLMMAVAVAVMTYIIYQNRKKVQGTK